MCIRDSCARLRTHPNEIALRGARGDRHDTSSREADGPPRLAGVVAAKYPTAMRAAPGASRHEGVGGEAGRAIFQAITSADNSRGGVDDEDSALGGDEDQGHTYKYMIARRSLRGGRVTQSSLGRLIDEGGEGAPIELLEGLIHRIEPV